MAREEMCAEKVPRQVSRRESGHLYGIKLSFFFSIFHYF